MIARWRGENSQKIQKRIVVEGNLVLKTPAHFGNGDNNEQTDMTLLIDERTRQPLLPGASIAGALKAYLELCQSDTGLIYQIFGSEDDKIGQSALIVHDAYAEGPASFEIRDGVRLDEASRTARHDALYNLSYWQAGTVFPLRFELLITDGRDYNQLLVGFVTALEGLREGGITLGARKKRGFGEVSVDHWRVRIYDFKQVEDLLDWLETGDEPLSTSYEADLVTYFNVQPLPPEHDLFAINAYFAMPHSLLIRSNRVVDSSRLPPDMFQLESTRNGTIQPVISGTTLAGVLRARAHKIASLCLGKSRADELINGMFGTEVSDRGSTAGRIRTYETVVENAVDNLVQTRVSIDRFTGGARDTALFTERPLFGRDETVINLKVDLYEATEAEIGLLLLVLKDLWTSDVVIGGERSVGRGRLEGVKADLTVPMDERFETYSIEQVGGVLIVDDSWVDDLQYFVDKFKQYELSKV